MTDLSTTPQTTDLSTGEPLVAHVIRKDEWEKGYIAGQPIEALCGVRWIPSRDPDRYPICPECRAVVEQIRASGEN